MSSSNSKPEHAPRKSGTDPASEETPGGSFADRIGEYPETFLGCRDYGHSWKPVTANRLKDGTYLRQLNCTVCNTVRTQQLDRSGYIIGSSYSYRVGYLIAGSGRLSSDHRATLRLENLSRSTK